MINKKNRSNLALASLAFATSTFFSISLDAATTRNAPKRDDVTVEVQASTENLENDQSLFDIATEELQDFLDQAEQHPDIVAISDAGSSIMDKLTLTMAYLKAKGLDATDAVVEHVTNNKGSYLTLSLVGTGIVIGWSLSRHCCRSSK